MQCDKYFYWLTREVNPRDNVLRVLGVAAATGLALMSLTGNHGTDPSDMPDHDTTTVYSQDTNLLPDEPESVEDLLERTPDNGEHDLREIVAQWSSKDGNFGSSQ